MGNNHAPGCANQMKPWQIQFTLHFQNSGIPGRLRTLGSIRQRLKKHPFCAAAGEDAIPA
jgi:hypothetical protein